MNTRKKFLTVTLATTVISCTHAAIPQQINDLYNYIKKAPGKSSIIITGSIAGGVLLYTYLHNNYFLSDEELIQRTEKNLDSSIKYFSEATRTHAEALLLLKQPLAIDNHAQALKIIIRQTLSTHRPFLAY